MGADKASSGPAMHRSHPPALLLSLLAATAFLAFHAGCESRPDRASFFAPGERGTNAGSDALPPAGGVGPSTAIPIPDDPDLPAPGARIQGEAAWDACPQRDDFELAPAADPAVHTLRNGATGQVGHIIDGDTLDVIVEGRAFRIRLLGFDTPECEKASQAVGDSFRARCIPHEDNDWWGYEAYCSAVNLASARRVVVTCDGVAAGAPCGTDVFNRWLAYVQLPDGTDFGERMLREGAAWSFTRYSSDKRARYCEAEDRAQEEGRGMWQIGRDAVIARMSGSNISWYRNRDQICAQARGGTAKSAPCLSDEDCDADERCAWLGDLGSVCAPRWFIQCDADEDCDAGSPLACRSVPGLSAPRCTPRWAGRFASGCFQQDEVLCGGGSECIEPRRCNCPDDIREDVIRLDDLDIDFDAECNCDPPGFGLCRFVAPACSVDADCDAGWRCLPTSDESAPGCLLNPEEWVDCPDELGGSRCVPPGWEDFLDLRDALAELVDDPGLPTDFEEEQGPPDLRSPTEQIGCASAPLPERSFPALPFLLFGFVGLRRALRPRPGIR